MLSFMALSNWYTSQKFVRVKLGESIPPLTVMTKVAT